LVILIFKNKEKITLNNIDKLLFFYLGIIFLYIIIPIGSASFYQKLITTKSIAFFPLIYFVGKLMPINELNIDKLFKLICLIAIGVASITIIEYIFSVNFQSYTGYAKLMSNYFNQDPSGTYDLSWTFETDNGLRRFASIYSMPLEHAAATLLTLSAILSLTLTNTYNKFKFDNFLLIALIASIISILLALSRASLMGYILIFYVFLIVTKSKQAYKILKYFIITLIILFLISIKDDIKNFFLGTLFFTNSSSLTHLLAWSEAIISIYRHPMGIGLGSIGSFVNSENSFFGGENEFLIIGVQVGFIPMLIYLYIYFIIIKLSYQGFIKFNGKIKKVALFIFLVKIGLILPLLTSEIETYIYVSYLVWFITGYYINLISKISSQKKISNIYD